MLYRLDPNATRECPAGCTEGRVNSGHALDVMQDNGLLSDPCLACNGDGRVPAEPEVEVRGNPGRVTKRSPALSSWVWFWRSRKEAGADWNGPYPTEAAALEAAREEVKG